MESSHQGGQIKGKIVGVCMGVCACVYLHICGVMGRVATESICKQFTEFEKIRNEERGTYRLWEQHQQDNNIKKAWGERRVQNTRFNLR